MFGLRPVNVVSLCHPPVGAVLFVLLAYSTACPLAGAVTAFTIMVELVRLASVGVATFAPGSLSVMVAASVVTVSDEDTVPVLCVTFSAERAKIK